MKKKLQKIFPVPNFRTLFGWKREEGSAEAGGEKKVCRLADGVEGQRLEERWCGVVHVWGHGVDQSCVALLVRSAETHSAKARLLRLVLLRPAPRKQCTECIPLDTFSKKVFGKSFDQVTFSARREKKNREIVF